MGEKGESERPRVFFPGKITVAVVIETPRGIEYWYYSDLLVSQSLIG